MRRVLRFLSAATVIALLGACATEPAPQRPLPPVRGAPPTPTPTPMPTPMNEFAWSQRSGANTLMGAVAYRPANTQVWSCAGQAIALTPETSYSRSRMASLYGSTDQALQSVAAVRTRSAANPGVDYSRFVRTTSCDAQDNFVFRDLPDGAYFIIVRVRRTRPPGAAGDEMVIMQRTELRGGSTIRLLLPRGAAAPPRQAAPPRPPPRR